MSELRHMWPVLYCPFMDRNLLEREVESRRWFHRIDLGDGLITPGDDDSPLKLKAIQMPADLTGLSVLDIGAWDGFFSFEAERRGASRVLATDGYVWTIPGFKRGFELAREALNSRVEDKLIALDDMSPDTLGMFDLVLFMGVLYHLPNPFLGVMRLASVTARTCIIETHVDLCEESRPAMVFYPGATLNNDATNYWGPNPACVIAMCKEAGFREVRIIETHGYHPSRMVFHAYK